MHSSLSFLIIIVSSLISVAFYTILERKFLSYIQTRKGPNKVGLMGILQPFSDAIKLFSKSTLILEQSNINLSSLSPPLFLFSSMIIIPILPFSSHGISDLKFNILIFLVISSMSALFLLLIGWSANSKFCHLGTIRSVAQTISYEVSLFFILLTLIMLFSSYNSSNFKFLNFYLPSLTFTFPLFLMWMICCLAETNRSPFDFAEGESELVSGFNVEYLGGNFALIFLSEYLSMLILSMLSSFLFMNFNLLSLLLSFSFFSILFLWIRGTFPRFRYDLLMSLNWTFLLPISISLVLWSTPFTNFSYC